MNTVIAAESGGTKYIQEGQVMRFSIPNLVLYGRGSAAQSLEALPKDQRRRVFVLSDENLVSAGVGENLITGLKQDASVTAEVYARPAGEPRVSEIETIVEAARAFEPTAVLAIGGGANMDAGKCVRILAEHSGSVRDYVAAKKVPATAEIGLIAVATTSGTGSETGAAGLMVDDETREKLVFPAIRPDVAVVDPDLTVSVPSRATAAAGLDALCQAVGAYMCSFRHPVADVLAREAIALLAANLVRTVEDGSDIEARTATAYGSLLSGMAMNSAGAVADQYLDEIIGPRYGVPHGMVAGLVLPYVLQFYRKEVEERIGSLAEFACETSEETSGARADQAISRLKEIADRVGAVPLAEAGVSKDDLPDLADSAANHFGVEAGYDPRTLTREGALAILVSAFEKEDPLTLDA